MLDSFEIVSTSGIVLWSKKYAIVPSNVVNSLIANVFIEERSNAPATADRDDASAARNPTYKTDGYTLKWTTAKDLGLIFVAVYQSLLHLSWIDKLLDNVRALFTELYRSQLKRPNTTVVDCGGFDGYFDRQVQELELRASAIATDSGASAAEFTPPSSSGTDRSAEERQEEQPPPMPSLKPPPAKAIYDDTSNDATPVPTPETSRPNSPAVNSHLLAAKGTGPRGKLSRRQRQRQNMAGSAPASSGDENPRRQQKARSSKKSRKWEADGTAVSDDEGDANLDYSSAPRDGPTSAPAPPIENVAQESWGKRTGKGEFVLKDLDEEMDEIIAAANAKKEGRKDANAGIVGSGLGAIGGLFRNVVGGKTLTKEDLEKPLKGMEDHLMRKNVAREAAVRLCESVERDLVGLKTGSFTSVETTIRQAMESALQKILTPTTSLDLLRAIQSTNAGTPQRPSRPYVLSIVGVNGVGKSTNLSKLAFFLLQNKLRVLIVAADTFRSGAVEQLRVHVRNLQELSQREGGEVGIYERGYGKDAANIARDAVSWAAENAWDVVLIDTAGRRHNDQRLMSSLEKFAQLARPDKIFMVGEALVGTDSVQQARNFNAAFGAGRGLDGFIISKCDTVGDMMGTLVSMVHATGIPVVFVGTGQHYTDLRTLNVAWATRLLLS
ncbi:signal recognition particle, alpha subunit, N-terminal-domain-containing protein [Lineolata rhizophorae]|uniref:Signal recognition particle receptor subunit alpha homolog n=1 Tax=Lineolata rhizophorae TaxID=578093 RepID=A0A6A6P2K1_9PEZI|nr:signal recognition particle, alpha subunit, N-terminal-domain-containing protein [Lineolata rhizophorae]